MQRVEFRLKLVAYFYSPTHSCNMASATYDVESIFTCRRGRHFPCEIRAFRLAPFPSRSTRCP
jgi:hypothetical protein